MPDDFLFLRRPSVDDPNRPTFLLIDDDSMVGRFIAHAAEECGHRAVRTTRFEPFAQSFRESRPASVAIDLCVPGCDGVEIIRFLADEAYTGTVLIISALDRRVVEAALRLGQALGLRMAEPLPKPFRLDHLACRLAAQPGLAREASTASPAPQHQADETKAEELPA